MSSIDKYITDVGRSMGANVRYVTRNGVITGYIGDTQIFSFPDRYGYALSTGEVAAIRSGIASYNRARAEAELRRIRELEEQRRRERLEQERKQAIADLRVTVNNKRAEIQQAVSRRSAMLREINAANGSRSRALAELQRTCGLLDFSEVERTVDMLAARQTTAAELELSRCQNAVEKIEELQRRVKDTLSTEQSASLERECRLISVSGISADVSSYSNNKLLTQLQDMKQQVQEMLPAIRSLESLKKQPGEIGIIATEALNTLQHRRISEPTDLKDLAQMTESRLMRIQELAEAGEMKSDLAEIEALRGAIAACRKTYEMEVESTYTAKDFRPEIEELAEQAVLACKRFEGAEFTTCSALRRGQIEQRLEEILTGDQNSSAVVKELEQLLSELVEYAEADKLHQSEYSEYKALVEQLAEYGVDPSEVSEYSASEYVSQKAELVARLSYEKREAEKSRLLVLDMQAKVVMENMGFEEFFTIGDADGYVRETLYTKKGYDGVLWQVIACADGTVSRRVIGVNENGAHETNPEYVLEVAKEMEEQQDPERFLQEFRALVGEPFNVVGAVEHDSPEAAEAIEQNGYFYLNGEALGLYKERVKAPAGVSQKAKVAQPKQVCVPGKAVRNTSAVLVSERERLMRRAT